MSEPFFVTHAALVVTGVMVTSVRVFYVEKKKNQGIRNDKLKSEILHLQVRCVSLLTLLLRISLSADFVLRFDIPMFVRLLRLRSGAVSNLARVGEKLVGRWCKLLTEEGFKLVATLLIELLA